LEQANQKEKPMKRAAALLIALAAVAPAHTPSLHAEETARYRLVENWAQFPPGVTKWGAATGVDVDSRDNVYVFHRNESMPIMAFDRNGKFLRAWGQGMFKTTHFLRVDRFGYVWITDRGDMQAFKFNSEGKLLMTLGKKGVTGDNTSQDAFNGMADVAVAKNGDIFIADGEGPNTRIAKFSKDGQFIKWWGGKGTEPGQFDQPHSIAIDSKGRVYVADRSNNRIQIFDQDGKFIDQWTNFGTPWGLFITKDDELFVVDGTEKNCLLIANTKDGKIIDRIDGLSNATAVAVDSKGSIYIGEVNGTNVKKYVRK
jgi:peptidylamidoglycolate lyase